MRSINPATGETVREYEEISDQELDERLDRADGAAEEWKHTQFEERAELLRAVAELLRSQRDEHARLMTTEMGKPITGSESEIDKCAWVCEYFADNAALFLAEEEVETGARRSFVRFDPLGAVLAIMPWNFPYWQVFRFAAPALMAGNVALLKHAENVPGCARAIERLFEGAGAPDGIFTTLLIDRERVDPLYADPRVRAVTLTGSVGAGRAVARRAGEQVKKTVLELGGSDPFIVLGDVDPVGVAARAVQARTMNSGQSCIAAKRFIVVEEVIEEFSAEVVRRMEDLRVGDPMNRDVDVGPMAREDLREALHDQVTRSLDEGAELRCGGEPLDGAGFFYPPTVLADVEPGMAAFEEETFGPVAAIVRAASTNEAIELANDSDYGLGASIWTAQEGVGAALAREIEAGCVFVNEITKSDPRLPFGGIKRSGYGRELSAFGIREFVNVKTVWVEEAPHPGRP